MDVKVFTEDGALELAEKLLQNDKDIKEELEQKGYATESFVTEKIAEAQLTDKEVDLSGYAKTEDLDDYATKEHTHDEYLTEHQDLSDYALKSQIPSVEGLVSEERLTEALSPYAKTSDIPDEYDDTALSNRITTVENDYLKSSDKTELTQAIATAKTETIEIILGETVDANFDTLQEVADWIQADTTASAELVVRVTDAESDIATIQNDYLKAVDKTELLSSISTNATAISKNTTDIAKNVEAIADNTTAIAVERARIDAFVALPEGSTTGDAALEDIKIKVDGTAADTAGNAVREQINTLDDKIDEEVGKLSSEIGYQFINLVEYGTVYENTSMDTSNGQLKATNDRKVVDVPINKNTEYIIANVFPDSNYIWYLDEGKNPISKVGVLNADLEGEGATFINENASYVRALIYPTYPNIDIIQSDAKEEYFSNGKTVRVNREKAFDDLKIANYHGFSPNNSASENTLALQKLLDKGGIIYVRDKGNYKIGDCVTISSNTTLIFNGGAIIDLSEATSGFLKNKGATSGVSDRNITIQNLQLVCNGNDTRGCGIVGMNGKINFLNVVNLHINGLICTDITEYSYLTHLCSHVFTLIENVWAVGRKDAIHSNACSNLTIRHCYFKTYDDPIALNAHDYIMGVPRFGAIQNVVIDDCIDEADVNTSGYFCRLLSGSWSDWKSGNKYRHSDIVVATNGVYRMIGSGTTEYVASVEPTHIIGEVAGADGITWRFIQSNKVYSVGCTNVHISNVYLNKNRNTAFSFDMDNNEYSRSYYPNSVPFIQKNITLENVYCNGDVENFVVVASALANISIRDCVINGAILYAYNNGMSGDYSRITANIISNRLEAPTETNILFASNRPINVFLQGNTKNSNVVYSKSESVEIRETDLF